MVCIPTQVPVAIRVKVLIDCTFVEQRFENFQEVLRHKVARVLNLDRLFSSESTDLLAGDTAKGS